MTRLFRILVLLSFALICCALAYKVRFNAAPTCLVTPSTSPGALGYSFRYVYEAPLEPIVPPIK